MPGHPREEATRRLDDVQHESLLGGALLGQKKYADAEPLLLPGYEGMKQRETTIPPHGQGPPDRSPGAAGAALRRLDKPDEAAKWRKELEACEAEVSVACGVSSPYADAVASGGASSLLARHALRFGGLVRQLPSRVFCVSPPFQIIPIPLRKGSKEAIIGSPLLFLECSKTRLYPDEVFVFCWHFVRLECTVSILVVVNLDNRFDAQQDGKEWQKNQAMTNTPNTNMIRTTNMIARRPWDMVTAAVNIVRIAQTNRIDRTPSGN